MKKDVAMTGEITLRGKVLPIGGVRDKVLAAHRAGIRTVILPEDNRKDLEEVPDSVRKNVKIRFAEHVGQVIDQALVKKRTSNRTTARPSRPARSPAAVAN